VEHQHLTAPELKPESAQSQNLLKHEEMLLWAMREWEQRYPDQTYLPVWASEHCANNQARESINAGRRMRRGVRFKGWKMLPCPYTVPINAFYMPGRKAVLTGSVGAFEFTFTDGNAAFPVLYVSTFTKDRYDLSTMAIALVPPERIDAWAEFERLCYRAVFKVERQEKVYILGGSEDAFEPSVQWDDVILPDTIKDELRREVETFFDKGFELYKQLNLPAFRKILLVGPPGTGKSTLCSALARIALERKCIVIYISSADKDRNSFGKIQRALNIVANTRFPCMLVVEELDVYLGKEDDKSQILNVLDGFETPNNPKGALMIATTNYPEIIDERISKRPGRIDRIVMIPPIENEDQATRMLQRYMGTNWLEDHRQVAPTLVGQTGAFVREVALYARMLAISQESGEVSVDVLRQSISSLNRQVTQGPKLTPQRPFGFKAMAEHHPNSEPTQNGHRG
jgi:AAA+ superfamily predicted ATPase